MSPEADGLQLRRVGKKGRSEGIALKGGEKASKLVSGKEGKQKGHRVEGR